MDKKNFFKWSVKLQGSSKSERIPSRSSVGHSESAHHRSPKPEIKLKYSFISTHGKASRIKILTNEACASGCHYSSRAPSEAWSYKRVKREVPLSAPHSWIVADCSMEKIIRVSGSEVNSFKLQACRSRGYSIWVSLTWSPPPGRFTSVVIFKFPEINKVWWFESDGEYSSVK